MRKNNTFHHKKSLKKSYKDQTQLCDHAQIGNFQNPEVSAKFCLLEISEQNSNFNNRLSNSPINYHFRSNSTQFFNSKKLEINKGSRLQISNEDKYLSLIKRNQQSEVNLLKSVTIKSTFSNEMRKTNNSKFYKTTYNTPLLNKSEKQALIQSSKQFSKNLRCQSREQFRRTSYFPLTVNQQKDIQKIDDIFRTTPSRKIIAILKKTKLAKNLVDSYRQRSCKQKQKNQNYSKNKMSIFNIRHIVFKESFERQIQSNINNQKSSLSPYSSFKKLNPYNVMGPQISQQQHSTNKNVIKLRLKNRWNSTSISNKT